VGLFYLLYARGTPSGATAHLIFVSDFLFGPSMLIND